MHEQKVMMTSDLIVSFEQSFLEVWENRANCRLCASTQHVLHILAGEVISSCSRCREAGVQYWVAAGKQVQKPLREAPRELCKDMQSKLMR